MPVSAPPLTSTLTTTEREVVALMALGYSNERISAALCLPSERLTALTERLFAKLEVEPTPVYHQRARIVLAWVGARGEGGTTGASEFARLWNR